MNPTALLKHAGLDAVDGRIKSMKTWQLWMALAVLAAVDVATAMFDLIPLVDDMIVGGLAAKVSVELFRRRAAAKSSESSVVREAA